MVMRMAEGLDTGPVLAGESVRIDRKTHGELHDELKQIGAKLLGRTLPMLEQGTIREIPQPGEGVTYAKKIEPSEARIDWSLAARALDCLIRGLSPRPGAWFECKGERIRLLLAEPAEGSGRPGTFLANACIACGEGALQPLSVQRAGRAVTDWQSFLRGFPLRAGERLN